MNTAVHAPIHATTYARSDCQIGVVHLGFGAFHRAHQAVYLDDYMAVSGDLRWGIAAVNLRGSEAPHFQAAADDIERHDGYFLKSYSSDGEVDLRRVRPHVAFEDWSIDRANTEGLLSLETVHLVTITVTESGYYTDPDGNLNLSDATIASEAKGGTAESVYGYLRAALQKRMDTIAAPLTIACCDNIRQNGKMLHRNLLAYLAACGDDSLAVWVETNVAFPCSMVDRITPRSPQELVTELTALIGTEVASPIMAEDFIQWVLQDSRASDMPDLARAGVTVTPDVDPYEETKIRVLNGGHTALSYLAALKGIETFDAAMRDADLLAHFNGFEKDEVLPAITINLPFSKEDYLQSIARRFSNRAIGDTIARICADGMAKFPIFIRPTLEGCLAQGIMPLNSIRSIASWHVFASHVAAGKIPFKYVEPSWDDLKSLLGTDAFIQSKQLWGDLPKTYPDFADILRHEISELETQWPV
ncbi:mannitol dehydrogenase family protein [Octadecabacter sp. G9-8]|uniref:Mannitol dehydrogenase family protein n=1 Tax=Octadecabacter dasysiphoniae TaxID=2909341 RepID=A0ABS9CQK5_9RHOB|nr:mannitol dehydrogenase family protein [Octadecabacter dasysiphoniae]MCF2869513.1 mannitol dehydrogenase family protein [Octadecabacter dasysiphoniae]